MVNKKIWLGVAVTVATTIAVGTTVINHVKADTDDKTVTVGIVGDSSRELWENVSKRTEKKYGVKIKIKVFSDYVKPNQALVDGSLDLNAFQTKVFFDDQNKKLGNKLAVSYTHLRAHETDSYLVCRLLLEKKKKPT